MFDVSFSFLLASLTLIWSLSGSLKHWSSSLESGIRVFSDVFVVVTSVSVVMGVGFSWACK